ncbi:hypothetical protein PPROV_000983900 [Pycnococcus provasolii]|uniref:SET domain-containing protein n=1 Tax=Pycnococcus provasolii TaxID=41880 RepID=A0A830I216_9CHLO|nr:hypothetical protein PPROV_000983900 [Pycnococcus provasolii]
MSNSTRRRAAGGAAVTRRRCTTLARATGNTRARVYTLQRSDATAAVDNDLRAWIHEHGGHVHASLRLVDRATTTNTRGVVCCESNESNEQDALIAIPTKCVLSGARAREEFAGSLLAKFQPQRALRMKNLPAELVLAMLLASERAKAHRAFYRAYVACLPDEPPSGFYLAASASKEDVVMAARDVGVPDPNEAADQAIQAATGARANAEQLVDEFRGVLCGATVDDVLWSMAHVSSRAFGGGAEVGLLPFIDLCNHSFGAAKPYPLIRREGDELVGLTPMNASMNELEKGDEAFLDYVTTGTSKQNAWVNFGFVPEGL